MLAYQLILFCITKPSISPSTWYALLISQKPSRTIPRTRSQSVCFPSCTNPSNVMHNIPRALILPLRILVSPPMPTTVMHTTVAFCSTSSAP